MDRETVMIVGNTKDAAEFIDGKYDSVGRSGRRSCRRCLVGNAAVVGGRVGDEHIGSITVHHGLGRRGMAVLVIHDIFYDVDDGFAFMHTRFPKHQRRIKYMNSNNDDDDDDDGEAVVIQLFVVVVLICLLPPTTKR